MTQWPDQKLGKAVKRPAVEVKSEIEAFFSKYFCSEAIFFPSARSALFHLSYFYELKRDDEVFIPRWSSHCLYNAFSPTSSPTIHYKEPKISLLNHKWGYFHSNKGLNSVIIEDSADSMLTDQKELFKNGGEFEIISLSKLLGVPGGCIAFFKDPAKKKKLEAIISEKTDIELSTFFWNNKKKYLETGDMSGYHYRTSNQLEPFISYASDEQMHYFSGIETKYVSAISKTLERYKEVLRFIDQLPIESVHGSNTMRIPTNVPIQPSKKEVESLTKKGLVLDTRNFNFNLDPLNSNYKPTHYIPIHIGISDQDFNTLISTILKKDI